MLMKLMKHELRATGRIMLPMLLLMLAAAVGGHIAVYRLMEARSSWMNALGGVLLAAFVCVMIAAVVVGFVLMIRRFYKNLLRDEGYLMMTLPVSVHAHILSKLLVSLVWFVLTALCAALAVWVLVYSPRLGVRKLLSAAFVNLRAGDTVLAGDLMTMAQYGAVFAVLMLTGLSASCLQLYAAMAAGHSFTRHKGLMSVAAFFAMMVADNALERIGGQLLYWAGWHRFRAFMDAQSLDAQIRAQLLLAIAVTAACAVIYELIAAYFLKRRLNLD